MPTILRSGPYRVYFYSHEPNEPAHVHVDRDKASCKVWLVPVALASSLGFGARELREVERLVSMNRGRAGWAEAVAAFDPDGLLDEMGSTRFDDEEWSW